MQFERGVRFKPYRDIEQCHERTQESIRGRVRDGIVCGGVVSAHVDAECAVDGVGKEPDAHLDRAVGAGVSRAVKEDRQGGVRTRCWYPQ